MVYYHLRVSWHGRFQVTMFFKTHMIYVMSDDLGVLLWSDIRNAHVMVTIISIPFVLKFISTHHILPVTASTLEGWGTQLHMADFTHLHILIHLHIPPTKFTHLHIPPPALLLALLIVTVCDALAMQRLLLTCHTKPSDALPTIYVAKNYLDDRWYLNEREGTALIITGPRVNTGLSTEPLWRLYRTALVFFLLCCLPFLLACLCSLPCSLIVFLIFYFYFLIMFFCFSFLCFCFHFFFNSILCLFLLFFLLLLRFLHFRP